MILVSFCLINLAAGLNELVREVIEMSRTFSRSRLRNFIRLTVPLLTRCFGRLPCGLHHYGRYRSLRR